MKKKILLASNCEIEDWAMKIIEEKTDLKVENIFETSTDIKSINVLKRHLTYISVAYKSYRHRNHYSLIIFWQQFIGLYYLLFSILGVLNKKRPKSFILTLIFKERYSLIGKLHKMLYKKAINSRAIDMFICHSNIELVHYQNQFNRSEKFVFCPVGSRMPDDYENTIYDTYFFAAGQSNRDYKTLIEAFRGLKENLIIACTEKEVSDLSVPDNVKIYHDAYGEKYLTLLKNSFAVIITIENPEISAGQLVLIEAMSFKKAVIITEGPCMDDYADTRFAKMIPPHSVNHIRKEVHEFLTNYDNTLHMGNEGYLIYKKNYTLAKYAERIADISFSLLYQGGIH